MALAVEQTSAQGFKPVGALEFVSLLSDLVGLSGAAGPVLEKAGLGVEARRRALNRAIDLTANDFGESLPGLADQLRMYLSSPAAKTAVERLSALEDPPVDRVVEVFCEAVGFYFEDDEMAVAGGETVMRSLLKHLDSELLRSTDALAYLDEKIGNRFDDSEREGAAQAERIMEHQSAVGRQILSALHAGGVGLDEVGRVVDAIDRSRLEYAKNEIERHAARRALPVLESLLKELQERSSNPAEALFETYLQLGNAWWLMDEGAEASKYYIAAAELRPSDVRAQRGRALAYLGLHDVERALAAIERVIADDPDDEKAINIKAIALLSQGRYAEVVQHFSARSGPEGKRHFALAGSFRLLAIAKMELGQGDEAIPLLEKAIQLGDPAPITKCLAGDLLLAAKDGRGISEDRGRLGRSLALHVEASSASEAIGDRATQALGLRGQALALMGLERKQEALERVDAAYGLDSGNAQVLQAYAAISMVACERPEVISRLERVLAKHSDEAVLSVLLGAFESGDLSRARELIEHVIPNRRMEALPTAVLVPFGRLLVRSDQLEEAGKVAETLSGRDEESAKESMVLRTHLMLREGRAEEARRLVDELPEDGDRTVFFDLANIFCEAREFAVGVKLFRRCGAGPKARRPLLRLFIRALDASSRPEDEQELLHLCAEHRRRFGADLAVTEIEVRLLEKRREFSETLTLWPKLLELEPHNRAYRLGQARCLFRLGDRDEAKHCLDRIPSPETLNPESAIDVARMYAALGEGEMASAIGYQAWRRGGYRHSTVSRAFIALFVRHGNDRPPTPHDLEAGCGTAVGIRFDNEREETFVVLRSDEEPILPEEVVADSAIARKLLGRKSGDEMEWSAPPGSPRKATVVSVLPSETWGLQYALKVHPERFPDDRSLTRFTVGEDLGEVLSVLDAQHERNSEALALYRKGRIPVGALGQLVGRGMLDTWGTLVADPELYVDFCKNTPEEREREQLALQSNTTAVMDPIFLIGALYLDLIELLPGLFKRLVVPQPALEDIAIARDQLVATGGAGATAIGRNDTGYFRTERAASDVANEIALLDRLLDFIRLNCEIRGRPRELSSEEESKLLRVYGEGFLLAIILAEAERALLLSDDVVVRALAHDEYGVVGANSWTVLDRLLRDGTMTLAGYCDRLEKMLRWGYRNVPISQQVLHHMALRDLNPASVPYRLALRSALAETATIDSSVAVAASFLRLLAQDLSAAVAEAFLAELLELLYRRGGKNAVRHLMRLVGAQYSLVHLPSYERLRSRINQWLSVR